MNSSTPTVDSDVELIIRIANKEQHALGLLYDRYARSLFSVIQAIVHDANDAEDILQDVFVQIWRNAGTYQPEIGSVRAWLNRIATHRGIDMLRSKRYQQKKREAPHATDDVDIVERVHHSNDDE